MRKKIEEVTDGFFSWLGMIFGFVNNKPVVVFTFEEETYVPTFDKEPFEFTKGTEVETVWVEVIPTINPDNNYKIVDDDLLYQGKKVGYVETELFFLEEPTDKSPDRVTCDSVFIKVSKIAGRAAVNVK